MNKKIINREEIIEQLAELLMTFDKEEDNEHRTVVHLRFDTNTNTVTLDTVVYTGCTTCNSHLNDKRDDRCEIIFGRCSKEFDAYRWAFYKNSRTAFCRGDDGFVQQCEEVILNAERIEDILDMSVEDFDKEVLDDLDDYDRYFAYGYYVAREDYEIDWFDRYCHILDCDDYIAKIIDAYDKHIDEHRADYVKKAEKIFDKYITMI